MSNLITQEFTPDQLKLIKDTVAKNATNDELSLFLHRCKSMGLDPLKSGQIHFVKFRDSPGTIIVGIDGFRARAASTGKHNGTKRGIIRDDEGKCLGAWAEVYRKDWDHPAREEVPLDEYFKPGRENSYGKYTPSMWEKMPETMIKKVAEVAALRMAFPDELGGLYSQEEMDQAEPIKTKDVKNADDSRRGENIHRDGEKTEAVRGEKTGVDPKASDGKGPVIDSAAPGFVKVLCPACAKPYKKHSTKPIWYCENWRDKEKVHPPVSDVDYNLKLAEMAAPNE